MDRFKIRRVSYRLLITMVIDFLMALEMVNLGKSLYVEPVTIPKE